VGDGVGVGGLPPPAATTETPETVPLMTSVTAVPRAPMHAEEVRHAGASAPLIASVIVTVVVSGLADGDTEGVGVGDDDGEADAACPAEYRQTVTTSPLLSQ
jgi:hypothetical protein